MTYQLPAAVRRQTADQIELFILDRKTEELAVQPARFLPDETGKMGAYRMRWLSCRNRRRQHAYFAVTTHPDGHATDSRFPGLALDLRYLDNQGRPYDPPGWVRARDHEQEQRS